MKLEQPRITGTGTTEERVTYLERYLFRLVQELQMALDEIEKKKEGG